MTIASDDIKTLVEIVGRLGAQVALSRSDKIRAEELLKIAENLESAYRNELQNRKWQLP